MSLCISDDTEREEPAGGADLGGRLSQLTLCCRGLELAVEDFFAGQDGEKARRLARLAAGVAEQSERLAKAATEGAPL
jgi:hypothetical protein